MDPLAPRHLRVVRDPRDPAQRDFRIEEYWDGPPPGAPWQTPLKGAPIQGHWPTPWPGETRSAPDSAAPLAD
jgi:hypothetical protein